MSSQDCVRHNGHTDYIILSSSEKDERLHNLEKTKKVEGKHRKRLSDKLNG